MKKTPQQNDEAEINAVAEKIGAILNEAGMGMQAIIQIQKMQKVSSPIIAAGNTETPNIITPRSEMDLPPEIMEMMKPVGDRIENK